MASTIEDSLRYWREYGMYINYFGNLWTKQTQHAFMDPDYFVAGCFLWPMILKIFPAILLCANILSDKELGEGSSLSLCNLKSLKVVVDINQVKVYLRSLQHIVCC